MSTSNGFLDSLLALEAPLAQPEPGARGTKGSTGARPRASTEQERKPPLVEEDDEEITEPVAPGLEGHPPRFVLLNPGPVVTSARVKHAMGADVSHRDATYSELLDRLDSRLLRVFGAATQTHSMVLLSGSGTAMVEAVISTFVPPGRKLLVVQNGAFGERLQEIATVHGVAAAPLRYGWGERVRPEDVEARLADDPCLYAVAMVHHETSVGTLNPIEAIGAVTSRLGRRFFADCISSLGGEAVDVVSANIDVAISCGNKCIHGVPGLAFACVRRPLWKEAEAVPARSVYLDLRRYHRFHEELRQPPFTPAVPAAFALDAALGELETEGQQRRVERYAYLARLMRAGFARLGLEVVNGGEGGCHVLTCVRMPKGVTFPALAGAMRARGFIIYDGKGPLSGRIFQVAHMGALTAEVVRTFLGELGGVLDTLRARRENDDV